MSAIDSRLSGVARIYRRAKRLISTPTAVAAIPIPSMTRREDNACLRISFSFPAPKSCAMSTQAPAEKPFPMEWDYTMPYGIVYAKQPSKQLQEFVNIIHNNLE